MKGKKNVMYKQSGTTHYLVQSTGMLKMFIYCVQTFFFMETVGESPTEKDY